jgi:hypothetical protein
MRSGSPPWAFDTPASPPDVRPPGEAAGGFGRANAEPTRPTRYGDRRQFSGVIVMRRTVGVGA